MRDHDKGFFRCTVTDPMRHPIPRPFATLVLATLMLHAHARDAQPALLPTGFIPNRGQVVDQQGVPNPAVQFLFQGDGLNVQLRTGGFSYDTWHPIGPMSGDPAGSRADARDLRLHRIDVQLEGSDPAAHWEAYAPSPDVLNYYTTATGENGVTGVHHYGRVVCRGIYPSIDLEFRTTGNADGVKYDFIVHPGGDPSSIRLRYSGARTVLDEGTNAVSVSWDDGVLHDRVPVSYWRANHRRSTASVSLVRLDEGLFTYSLKDAPIAGAWPGDLVIDPIPTVQWGTYYGNADHHGSLNGTAIDPSGNTIAVGTAAITGLASSGAHDQVLSGSTDALLVELNSSGQRVWATYYGGSGADFGNAVDVDANGAIYFTGDTWSTGSIATTGAHQTAMSTAPDAFLAKFNSNGTRAWGTYYGGTGEDHGNAVVLDGAGEPAIAGTTKSITGIASTGGADVSYGGSGDAFLAKFYSTGAREWATYLGGSGSDNGLGLGCDNTYFFLCGSTVSTTGIALGSTHQTSLNTTGSPVPSDAYVVKYSGLGQKMWGTYYGGPGADEANSCFAELGTGKVYVAGETFSTAMIASLGAHQGAFAGAGDAFLVKFDYVGTRVWGTYLGGPGGDVITAVSEGSLGRVYVAGSTSSASGIATSGSTYPTYAGSTDAFVNCFTTSGARLWGTYYGGADHDAAFALATDGLDFAIGGITSSTSNIATPGTFQSSATIGPGNIGKFVAYFNTPFLLPRSLSAPDEPCTKVLVHADARGCTLFLPEEVACTSGQRVTVRVFDAAGREVFTTRMAIEGRTIELPCAELPAGTYSVILDPAAGRSIGRFALE